MHFRVSVGTDASFIFIPLVFLFAKKSLGGRWICIILGAINFIYLVFKNKYKHKDKSLIIFFVVFFIICFLLLQRITKPIWDNFFLLRSFGVPWRMLVPISFATAVIGALVTKYCSKKLVIFFCLL